MTRSYSPNPRRYQGPKGQLERAIYAAMRPGMAHVLPLARDDKARRAAMLRMVARGVLERIDDGHVRRNRRPAYRHLDCRK